MAPNLKCKIHTLNRGPSFCHDCVDDCVHDRLLLINLREMGSTSDLRTIHHDGKQTWSNRGSMSWIFKVFKKSENPSEATSESHDSSESAISESSTDSSIGRRCPSPTPVHTAAESNGVDKRASGLGFTACLGPLVGSKSRMNPRFAWKKSEKLQDRENITFNGFF